MLYYVDTFRISLYGAVCYHTSHKRAIVLYYMELIFVIVILIMSVVIHELAHGYAAYAQGDPTAAMQGRLTLNPIHHLDLLGSIIVPGLLLLLPTSFIIGWAKPVPFNPYNLRNQRWGHIWVVAAGPLSNIGLAAMFALGIRFISGLPEQALALAGYVVLINLVLALFNLIPIPPLDGSQILFGLLPERFQHWRHVFEGYGFILVFLVVFLFLGAFSRMVIEVFHLVIGPQLSYVLALIQNVMGG